MIASRVAATALNSEKMEADWRNQYTVHDRELLVHSMIAECEKHVFEGDREQVRKLVLHYENSSYVQAATRTEYNERLKRLLETARGGELRTKLQDIHNKRAQLHQQDVASTMHATHQWVQDHSAATVCSPTVAMLAANLSAVTALAHARRCILLGHSQCAIFKQPPVWFLLADFCVPLTHKSCISTWNAHESRDAILQPWSPVTMGMVGSRGMESSPQTPAADPNSNNVAAGKKRKLSRTNTANSQTAKPPKAPRGGKKVSISLGWTCRGDARHLWRRRISGQIGAAARDASVDAYLRLFCSDKARRHRPRQVQRLRQYPRLGQGKGKGCPQRVHTWAGGRPPARLPAANSRYGSCGSGNAS